MKTLKDTAVGQTVTVRRVHATGAIKRRIMDMGVTKGTVITVRRVAPLADPIEVNLRGYELTIRKHEAETIEVE